MHGNKRMVKHRIIIIEYWVLGVFHDPKIIETKFNLYDHSNVCMH